MASRTRSRLLFPLALCLAGGLVPPAAAQHAEPAVAGDAPAAALERDVRFLAADALEGRATGSPGNARAAEYLAAACAAAGLAPAGDGGSFLQAVPLLRVGADAPPALTLLGTDGTRTELVPLRQFSVRGGASLEVRLELVRVAAEEQVPEPGANLALWFDASRAEAERWLEARGAPDGAGFGAVVVRGRAREGTREFRPSARVTVPERAPAEGTPMVQIHGPARQAFEDGDVAAIELRQQVLREPVESHNVLARIDGGGAPERPELAREAIVLSAHFDHIGAGTAPEDATEEQLAALDLIYNGADDDASGTAVVLELARRFARAAQTEPPARTLVFLFATGEEIGLLGTEHYLEHPAVPLTDTVCNLNFEMLGRPDALVGGPGRMWLTGPERSNLMAEIAAQGIAIAADPRPEQRFFQRSDNYAFAVRGIVAQTLSSYDLHTDYHQVTDEADTLDYAHLAACAEAGYRIARRLADGAIRPEWLEGMRPEPRRR